MGEKRKGYGYSVDSETSQRGCCYPTPDTSTNASTSMLFDARCVDNNFRHSSGHFTGTPEHSHTIRTVTVSTDVRWIYSVVL
jgi:hypothetical protein